jgi:hypothetical protein
MQFLSDIVSKYWRMNMNELELGFNSVWFEKLDNTLA